MTIEILNMSSVENAMTVPLRFTLEIEGPRDQGKNEWMKKTYAEYCSGMQWHIAPWCTGCFCQDHLFEVGLTQNWEIMTFQSLITLHIL